LTQVLIIGSGLSGLFSACLTSMEHLQTTVVSRGHGGLSLSHGAIELFNRASPSRAISKLDLPHPYALAGRENLIEGIKHFLKITELMDLHYEGGRSSNQSFLTATGMKRSAAYLPASFTRKLPGKNVTLAAFENLRDFQPYFAADRFGAGEDPGVRVTPLPLLDPFTNRELYPTDIARHFDDLEWTAENTRAWKPLLIGSNSIGLPAVLGLKNHLNVFRVIEEILSIPVFEIPTLPPNIPGLRLEIALRDFAIRNGTRFIDGPTAKGRVRKGNHNVRVAGALLDSAGRQSVIDSSVTILATGSFLHGGLAATQDHRVYEPVFNLPVDAAADRSHWIRESIFSEQHYATYGVSVDSTMRPLDIHGDIFYENLYAVGGVLRGSDRTYEGSRQGIDISTVQCAINHILRNIR
jgi:glycerol-3-phosphate dehydrogenase subunit B